MTEHNTGSCLCGAVHFRTRGELRGVIYCHCTQCRKQSGHMVAATAVAEKNFELEGAENLAWYSASPGARRGFCSICGSLLFWKDESLARISIMAGSFDKPTGLKAISHIFTGDKGDYYQIADALPQSEKWGPV